MKQFIAKTAELISLQGLGVLTATVMIALCVPSVIQSIICMMTSIVNVEKQGAKIVGVFAIYVERLFVPVAMTAMNATMTKFKTTR